MTGASATAVAVAVLMGVAVGCMVAVGGISVAVAVGVAVKVGGKGDAVGFVVGKSEVDSGGTAVHAASTRPTKTNQQYLLNIKTTCSDIDY